MNRLYLASKALCLCLPSVFASPNQACSCKALDDLRYPGERWGDLLIKVFVEELSPNGQTITSFDDYTKNIPGHMVAIELTDTLIICLQFLGKSPGTRGWPLVKTLHTIHFTSRSVKLDFARRELMTVM